VEYYKRQLTVRDHFVIVTMGIDDELIEEIELTINDVKNISSLSVISEKPVRAKVDFTKVKEVVFKNLIPKNIRMVK
jgi:hypothetical protein